MTNQQAAVLCSAILGGAAVAVAVVLSRQSHPLDSAGGRAPAVTVTVTAQRSAAPDGAPKAPPPPRSDAAPAASRASAARESAAESEGVAKSRGLAKLVAEVRASLAVEQLPDFERVNWDGLVPRLDLPSWEAGLHAELADLALATREAFLLTLTRVNGEFGLRWGRFKTWYTHAGRELREARDGETPEAHERRLHEFNEEKQRRTVLENQWRARAIARATREFLARDLNAEQRGRYLALPISASGDAPARPWRSEEEFSPPANPK